MRCLECTQMVRHINFSHLRRCSGITPAVYRERHPGAELMDPDVRRASGLPMERNPKWRGGRAYRRCRDCQRQLSGNSRGNFCASCRPRAGANNSFYGKRHSRATRDKMVLAAKQRDPVTYVVPSPTPGVLSGARKQDWARFSPEQRSTRLTSWIAAGQAHNRRASKTRIENIMAGLLDDLRVAYQRNVQLGRYNVDFLVAGTLVIECFGDYWHCNPIQFAADAYHRSLHLAASEKWQRDAERAARIEAQGYGFASYWESDICSNLASVRESVVALIRQTCQAWKGGTASAGHTR